MSPEFVVAWANATRRVLDQREHQLTQMHEENARLRAWVIALNGAVPEGHPGPPRRTRRAAWRVA